MVQHSPRTSRLRAIEQFGSRGLGTGQLTGANRGLGRHFAEQLRERGATVYAAACYPDAVEYAGVTPFALDDAASITEAARVTGDVTIVSNNAGSSTGAYCAATSAEWSLTNALRQELASQGTRVSAIQVSYMDADMTRGIDAPKADPALREDRPRRAQCGRR
jgi:NAD(P)-dependent dehydrogenase (short-subunit alcohol dehydrogenase family)